MYPSTIRFDLSTLMRPRFISAILGILTVVIFLGCIPQLTAVQAQGTVRAWGANLVGELGIGRFGGARTIPSPLSGLTRVTAISAAGSCVLALKADGTVVAWGDNSAGQLGNGSSGLESSSPAPVTVKGLTRVTAVATSGSHSLALRSDGTVMAWGDNSFGQIGDGSSGKDITRTTPLAVKRLASVIAIAVGANHSLALKSDGTVMAWGDNSSGQLGDGTSGKDNIRTTPVAVKDLTGVIAIAAGGFDHSLALKSDGSVVAWGADYSTGDETNVPVIVQGLTGIKAISAGQLHALALKSNGSVVAWGENQSGQLGDGTLTERATPVPVKGLSGVMAIAAGGSHSLALKSDGRVVTWGTNDFGQLGNGTKTALFAPGRSMPGAVRGLVGATAIAAGLQSSFAVIGGAKVSPLLSSLLGDGRESQLRRRRQRDLRC